MRFCFEARKIFNEDLPLQMIHLMLNTHRLQLFGFELERRAVQAHRAHVYPLGTLDWLIDPGHGQAAFFAEL